MYSKLTFVNHVRIIRSVALQELDIFRKATKVFGDVVVTPMCFKAYVFPLVECRSQVGRFASDLFVRLFERVVTRAQFICIDCKLGHQGHRGFIVYSR